MQIRSAATDLAQRAATRGQHGQIIPPADLIALVRDLGVPLPAWLSDLLTSVPLSGLELGWQESPGSDGIAWLRWSDALGIRSESLECFPGCAILPRGYISVASCLEGSGDPYFVCLSEGDDPPLYRVYHDVSDEADVIIAEGLLQVAPSLSSFFRTARFPDEDAV